MNNNVYHLNFSKKEKSTENSIESMNDENYTAEDSMSVNVKSQYLSKFWLFLRYVGAISLYIAVAFPLGVISSLKWLILFFGSIATMGITIFYFMGSGMNGYMVCLAWLALSAAGCADEILAAWIESRFPFKLFRVTKES